MDHPNSTPNTDGLSPPDEGVDSVSPRGLILRRLLPLAVVLVAVVVVFLLGLDDYLTFDTLARHRKTLVALFEDHQFLAIGGFVLVYTLVIALSLPGAVWLSIGGGFLFGTVLATFWNVVGATAGAVVIFLVARYALADFFHGRLGPRLRDMEKDFQDNAFNYLLVLRLVPLFPFWLVNLVPALLNVRLSTYVLATVIGIIPGSYVFSSIGNGAASLLDRGEAPDLSVIFTPDILIPLLGLALLSTIPVIYKKYKAHGEKT